MLVSGDGCEICRLLLLTEMWRGLSWSARLLMALARLLLASTGLLTRDGRVWGEVGEWRAEEPGDTFLGRGLGVRQMVQAAARG